MNMGLIEVPYLQDYWSGTWPSHVPFFSSVMSRERFNLIFWLLHVSHTKGAQPQRIHKVKAFLDLLLANFQASYNSSREISVDETIVDFRGRFGPRVYMPKKPNKYGIKAFTMADSDQGYLLNILVYTGADTLVNSDQKYNSLPQPARVVLHVSQKYLDRGHHIFTDRYYTSLPLAKVLLEKHTTLTGTCMRNRVGLPPEIRQVKRIGDNEVIAFRDDRIMVLEWRAPKSKSSVVMLSTECKALMTPVRMRRNGEENFKPLVVHTYNQSMNGIDKADQNIVYYAFIRKPRKWWRKLFFLVSGGDNSE